MPSSHSGLQSSHNSQSRKKRSAKHHPKKHQKGVKTVSPVAQTSDDDDDEDNGTQVDRLLAEINRLKEENYDYSLQMDQLKWKVNHCEKAQLDAQAAQQLAVAARKDVEARLEAMMANPPTVGKEGKKKKLLTAFDSIVRKESWRPIKFVQDDADVKILVNHVLNCYGKQYDASLLSKEPRDLAERDKMFRMYKGDIVQSLNKARCYFQQCVKEAYQDYHNLAKKNRCMPTAEHVLSCANRTTTDEALFEWYWDVLLVKVVGVPIWGKNYCYYAKISEAKMPSGVARITESTEAMAVLFVENNYQKWFRQFQWLEDHADDHDNKHLPKWSKNASQEVKDLHESKYSRMDGGQQLYGGWSPEAFKRLREIEDEVIEARQQKRGAIMEEKIYNILRANNKITAHSSEAMAKAKKRKRPVTPENMAPKVDNLIWLDHIENFEAV